MSQVLAVNGIIDWEAVTGQSRFIIDLVSIPFFSAIAGVITNWTGVLMLFAPVRFSGFVCPGVKQLYPFLPRKLQILPIFAPGGVLGFQGFIPARAEKMASICVDKGLAKVGSVSDFVRELDPDGIADHLAVALRPQVPQLVNAIMEREHPQLWADLPPQMKELVYVRVDQQVPRLAHHVMDVLGTNMDQLIDVKLLTVGHLRRHPEVMKDIIYKMGSPELKFMVTIGWVMGFPLGVVLALWLHFVHDLGDIPILGDLPIIGSILGFLGGLPAWLWVIGGGAIIGIIVNIIAIKVVFEPGEPQPRYKYLWKQAKFAKRQHEAAGAFGHSIAYDILTLPNIANELLHGPRGDKTQRLIEAVLEPEINRIIGPVRAMVRVAIGTQEFDRIMSSTSSSVVGVTEGFLTDVEFGNMQAAKIDAFATAQLRALPPSEFMDMLYSAVEQDAWLLYAHGGFLGLFVGALHLFIFGA